MDPGGLGRTLRSLMCIRFAADSVALNMSETQANALTIDLGDYYHVAPSPIASPRRNGKTTSVAWRTTRTASCAYLRSTAGGLHFSRWVGSLKSTPALFGR